MVQVAFVRSSMQQALLFLAVHAARGFFVFRASNAAACYPRTFSSPARLRAPPIACDWEDFGDAVEYEETLARYTELGLLGQATATEAVDEEDGTTPEDMVVRAAQPRTRLPILQQRQHMHRHFLCDTSTRSKASPLVSHTLLRDDRTAL